jgi:ABC-type sugar transport system substrate-binding protein
MSKNVGKLLIGLLLLTAQINAVAQSPEPAPPKVAFLNPNPPGNTFWDMVTSFMQAVAEDLNIDLHVVHSKGNPYSYKKDGLDLVETLSKGDYLITAYFSSSSSIKYIQRANERGVKIFVINTGIPEDERQIIGKPREKLENWIGHMAPSDFQAGYELADILINKATALNKGSSTGIHVVALGGGTDSIVPLQRLEGFKKRVAEQSSIRLDDLIDTMWTRPEANVTARELLHQNSEAQIVWTLSDPVALGVIDAIKAEGKKPGVDILTGGIDWSPEAISAVASGEMTASVGGHFFEGGWALVLINDYHYGIDFADDPGVKSTTKMSAITADNVQTYLKRFNNPDWNKIDFKQFSKKYNPSLKKYDFYLETLHDAFDDKT